MLVVCTANRCRSPLAAALLERQAVRRGLAVDVRSAGLLSAGLPVPEVGVSVARRRGLDVGAHRSRRVDRALLLASDLVVTMTRQQAREVDDLAPERRPRVFPLNQLVPWLAEHGPVAPYVDLGAWLDAHGGDRPQQDLLGVGDEDVADPMGRRRPAWMLMMRTFDRAVPRLLDGLEPALLPRPLTSYPRER